jgi:hypothetical protein
MADMRWKKDPYLRDVKKDTSGFGEGRYTVVRIGQTTGIAGSFTEALNNQNPTAERRFFVTDRTIYAVFSMKGSFLRKARGKPNSLLKGYESQARSAMYDFDTVLADAAWNDVGGSKGQISASQNLASNVLTFRNAKALFGMNWLGKKITFASDSGAGTSPAGERGVAGVPTTLTVTGVNHSANTLTLSAALNTVPGITVNDFIFVAGFYAVSLTGKRGWNPITAPTGGDSHFGVDRTEAVEQLSGWRQPSAGLREHTLIEAMTLGDMANTETARCYTNGVDWKEIVKEVGSKYVREVNVGKQGIGAKGLAVFAPQGECMVLATNRVPVGNAWVGDPAQDVLRSEGEIPQILNEDKVGPMLRSASDDAYQSRLGGDANFMPDDTANKLGPGAWVIVTW